MNSTKKHQLWLALLCLSLLSALSACGDAPPPEQNPSTDYDVRDVVRMNGEQKNCLVSVTGHDVYDLSSPDLRLLVQSPCVRVTNVTVDNGSGFEDVWFLGGVREASSLRISLGEATNLSGVEQLQRVTWRFNISGNFSLTDLTALSSLERVDREFFIQSNYSLRTLEGLESLESVQHLVISGNESLESIEHLDSLQYLERLDITDNPNLPQCEAEAFAARFEGIAEDIEVKFNGGGEQCD